MTRRTAAVATAVSMLSLNRSLGAVTTDIPSPVWWPPAAATPPLDLADLGGSRRGLPEFRGHAVLLNFWASWCPPCRTELSSLAQLDQLMGGKGLVVLTVNFKESARLVRRFLQPRALDLPVLLDVDGGVAARWNVKIFPTTFLLDPAGRVRWSVRGEADWSGTHALALIDKTLSGATRKST